MPNSPKNVVVCVLKSGRFQPRQDMPYSVEYGAAHVQWLQRQFKQHCSEMDRFVCLTDIEIPGVDTIALEGNLPGWWSKLEVFRAFTRAAYCDLDTVLVGDPSRYLFHNDQRFMVSTGINILSGGAINTSLMAWNGNYRWIYERMMKNPGHFIGTYNRLNKWGDQGFLRDQGRGRIYFCRFQHRYPGFIMNYKRDFLTPPAGPRQIVYGQVPAVGNWQRRPRVVFFNGARKPWEVTEPWIPPLDLAPAA